MPKRTEEDELLPKAQPSTAQDDSGCPAEQEVRRVREEVNLLACSTDPRLLQLCWVWETATLQQGDSENHSLRAGMAPGKTGKARLLPQHRVLLGRKEGFLI